MWLSFVINSTFITKIPSFSQLGKKKKSGSSLEIVRTYGIAQMQTAVSIAKNIFCNLQTIIQSFAL